MEATGEGEGSAGRIQRHSLVSFQEYTITVNAIVIFHKDVSRETRPICPILF